ncbi:hypothetical protein Ddc_19095 [Ditylenchus destructor]|nr:hypothetical protein Ddc_19095 [Ditylenchus destructor]
MPPKPKTPKKKKLDSDKAKNIRDVEQESDMKLDSGKGKITQEAVGEDETTVFVRVNAKIQPAKSKLHVNKNFAKTMQDAGKAYEEESGKQETSMRSPVAGAQLKHLLSEFKALQEENNEHGNILQQLKKEVRIQHDALQRDSCRLYDFMSESGCGIKPVGIGQETNKSQRQGVVAAPQKAGLTKNSRLALESFCWHLNSPENAGLADARVGPKARGQCVLTLDWPHPTVPQLQPPRGIFSGYLNEPPLLPNNTPELLWSGAQRPTFSLGILKHGSKPLRVLTSPNPTHKQNLGASSNAATGSKMSGLPAPLANKHANGPAAPPGVRNPNNDVNSCYVS